MKGRRFKRFQYSVAEAHVPVAEVRDFLTRFADPLVSRLTPNTRLFILAFIFTLITTLLLGQSGSRQVIEKYNPDDIVRGVIVSPADISSVDKQETARQRGAARNNAEPVFIFDSNSAEQIVTTFRSTLDALKQKFKSDDSRIMHDPLSQVLAQALNGRGFNKADLNKLTRLLRDAS
ncbi:MAG: hypothetical protein ACRD63_11990, partial [Pyrinomonadaceae bacterium]